MTTNHHTPYSGSDPLTSTILNAPLSELDTAIGSASVLTTKGDVYTYSTVAARLAVGTNGYILVADSSQTTGLKWVPGASYFAIFRDEKTSGTESGASSATTWNIRDLNTEVSDTRSMIAISSNQFTPIAGTYLIQASAPAFDTGDHRLKLYNVTQTADVVFGSNYHSSTGGNDQTTATLVSTFTADGADAYEIRHYTVSAKTTNGLGQAVSDGAVEVYCEVFLQLISV